MNRNHEDYMNLKFTKLFVKIFTILLRDKEEKEHLKNKKRNYALTFF